MPIVIVPNDLRDTINKTLDDAYERVPDAANDREYHYKVLLYYFYEHGTLPDFTLAKREDDNEKS